MSMTKVTGMVGDFVICLSLPFFAGARETDQRAACIDEAYKGELFFAGEEITPTLQQSIDLVE